MSHLTFRSVQLLKSGASRLHGTRRFASGKKLVEVSTNEDTEISIVTLNRLPVNSVSLELLRQFNDTLDELEKKGIRGAIIQSASPKVFSAGIDLAEIYNPDPVRLEAYWSALQDAWTKLYGSSFQTVSVIDGHAPGAGCLLALSCDYRVMVESRKNTIGLNETQFGIAVPEFAAITMRNIIGKRQSELALTSGKLFSVDEALRLGLIDQTATDKADALKKADKYFEKFASFHQLVVSTSKNRCRQDTLDWMTENREKDLRFFVDWFQKPEVQKNLRTIVERMGVKKA